MLVLQRLFYLLINRNFSYLQALVVVELNHLVLFQRKVSSVFEMAPDVSPVDSSIHTLFSICAQFLALDAGNPHSKTRSKR